MVRKSLNCILVTVLTFILILSPLPKSTASALTVNSSDIMPVGAGGECSFVLNDGRVWAWGYNKDGYLGLPESDFAIETPTMVEGIDGVEKIEVGKGHILALRNGSVWAWGNNGAGQIGDGTDYDNKSPQDYSYCKNQPWQVEGMNNVKDIATGCTTSFAIKNDGSLWGWGWNVSGQIGDGTTTEKLRPVRIPLNNVIAVDGGDRHSAALTRDGQVWAWGWNAYGELGDGNVGYSSFKPKKVPGMTGVKDIVCGWYYTLALKEDGTVWGWGDTRRGQLGIMDHLGRRSKPVKIEGLSDVIDIQAGNYHALALKNDGTVWAWGGNIDGQLGDGTWFNNPKPKPVSGLSNIVAISTTCYHNLAVEEDGTVWAWGRNTYGCVDPDQKDEVMSPVKVKGIRVTMPHQNPYSRLSGQDRYQTAIAISKEGWSSSDNAVIANGLDYHDALVGSPLAYQLDAPLLLNPPKVLDQKVLQELSRLRVKNVYLLGNTASLSQEVQDELEQKGFSVSRISNDDKLGTAVAVGNQLQTMHVSDTVFIATQENFPDALAVAPFACKNGWPIMFSQKNSLRQDTKQALERWHIKKALIAGGTGVISSTVAKELEAMGITVERLQGKDRYETALAIAKRFNAGDNNTLTLATGENYPDSLAGAVYAAKQNSPLILISKQDVAPQVLSYIKDLPVKKLLVFGGNGVITDALAKYIANQYPPF